uniref:Protein kinase 4-like n=1 Tax=Dermatophagoides pteronyssinus TaxID=6956 RepID=A0A6P6YED5_DERPT
SSGIINNRKNWAYLRLKGLIVITVLLIIIGIGCALLRRFLSSSSVNNDTHGTHPHHPSVLLALKQRRRRKQNEQDEKTKNLNQQTTVSDEKSNHEELISSIEVHNDRHENNQQQHIAADDKNKPDEIIQLDQDADNVVEQQQNRIWNKHDTNESTIRTKQQQTFHCWPSRSLTNIPNHEQTNQPKNNIDSTLSSLSFSLSSLLESVSTKQDQTIIDSVEPTSALETTIIIIMKPIRECLAIIKRCLNRSMRNGSHYGAYNLSTTTTHDNFSVDFDDDDDDDGQQIEVSCTDNHKWRNQNKRTLTDYRYEQKQQQQENEKQFTNCNDNDNHNDLNDTNIIVADSSSSSSSSSNSNTNSNINGSNRNAIGFSFNKRMIREESQRTTTKLTKLLNRLHIRQQPSSNQHYHHHNQYDPKTYRTTTTAYSFLPAAIMANNVMMTNDNVAETTKNVQLLYVSQKNLY